MIIAIRIILTGVQPDVHTMVITTGQEELLTMLTATVINTIIADITIIVTTEIRRILPHVVMTGRIIMMITTRVITIEYMCLRRGIIIVTNN
ncbi:MAG: hypothetical protein K9M03_04535 [Kiritimatiellales bacterium]|nr:hypothetical protein [Kiritimatiellales bacterium]